MLRDCHVQLLQMVTTLQDVQQFFFSIATLKQLNGF